MAKTYPVIERAGGRITVLARTAEEAHDAVTRELGGSCTIVSVERVRSGGLGGFFATELVRLVAAPRRVDGAVADTSTFASAEDLVFALPGGGGQFAARLKEELDALTTKGTAAAEATMGRVAPAPLPTRPVEPAAHRSVIEPDDGVPTWTETTATTDRIEAIEPWRAVRHRVEPEPSLPSSEELHWGAVEERPHVDDDDMLLAAWSEMEAGVEVVAEPAAPAAPPATPIPVAEGFAPAPEPVPAPAPAPILFAPVGPTDNELDAIAEMLATELDLGDERAITPRARLIRGGPRAVVDTSSVDDSPLEHSPTEDASVDGALPATLVEPVVPVAEFDPAPPIAPPPVSAPTYEAPVDRLLAESRPVLPIRQRILVPTPVTPLCSWSAPTLRAFGVPDGIVDRMAAQNPCDDLEWTVAFMLSVRDLCRDLPHGPSVLVGPSGANLARQLGLMSCSGDELGVSALSVASPNAGPVTLRRAAGGRHVHLVVGGNWHHLVTVRPTVVSAATEHDLLEALRVAEAWGATLGWTQEDDRYVRIDPYLLAGRVRELLPDRAEAPMSLAPPVFPPID